MAKRASATVKKGLKGKLKKAGFGYSLPLDQPLYHPAPVTYQDSTILMYCYETDPKAAAALLPSQLNLTETPMVRMIFANYKFSSIGFYNEVAQAISCVYKGKVYNYAVRLHVTSDRAMAAGREMAGFPKKIGHIEFNAGAEYLSYLDSPAGLRICSGVLIPGQRQIEIPPCGHPLDYISLRVIPDPANTTKPYKPSLCELLSTVWELGPGELWSAHGNVHLSGASDLDPYHDLPIVKQHPCQLYRGGMTVSKVKVLQKL